MDEDYIDPEVEEVEEVVLDEEPEFIDPDVLPDDVQE
jgi:hypothetical protein